MGIRFQSQIVADQPPHRSAVLPPDEIESVEAQDDASADVSCVRDQIGAELKKLLQQVRP